MRWSEFRHSLSFEDRERLTTFLLSGVDAARLVMQTTRMDGDVEDLRFGLTAAIESLDMACTKCFPGDHAA
jgi:hypothetical protein